MKRSANIKDLIMMPPPKARPKSRSDTSEELRKNLTESITHISDNSILQDEIQKFFKENEELEMRKNDDELSISKSTSSYNFDKFYGPVYSATSPVNFNSQCGCNFPKEFQPPKDVQINNIQTNNINLLCHSCSSGNVTPKKNQSTTCENAFNFNLVNYNYNYTQLSDEEENLESLEKLKRNLKKVGERSFNYTNNYKNFMSLPPPKNKKEIKRFVNNLYSYISEHEFDSSLLILKIKIQTRDNDFKNHGLKIDYYQESLIKMQKELVSRICMFNEEKVKIENGTYQMLKNKRKRTVSSDHSSSEGSLSPSYSDKSASSQTNLNKKLN